MICRNQGGKIQNIGRIGHLGDQGIVVKLGRNELDLVMIRRRVLEQMGEVWAEESLLIVVRRIDAYFSVSYRDMNF
jgi:hypothetical protein